MDQVRDLLGTPLTAVETEVLELYRRLHALSERLDAPPCVRMNSKQAMVLLWNAAVDLDAIYEEPATD
jgi:hypothetical protein